MIYKNIIELDNNKKAIKCPKCENEEILEGPYCKICGLELFNRCSNFDENNWNGCGEVCDANARYCHKCGAPTLYYNLGLIPDFHSENIEAAAKNISDDLPF